VTDWNAADARRRFAQLLHDASVGSQVVMLRGKAVGVMVSYDSCTSNRKAFAEKSLARWLEDLAPLHDLEGDVDLPTRRSRQYSLGIPLVNPFG